MAVVLRLLLLSVITTHISPFETSSFTLHPLARNLAVDPNPKAKSRGVVVKEARRSLFARCSPQRRRHVGNAFHLLACAQDNLVSQWSELQNRLYLKTQPAPEITLFSSSNTLCPKCIRWLTSRDACIYSLLVFWCLFCLSILVCRRVRFALLEKGLSFQEEIASNGDSPSIVISGTRFDGWLNILLALEVFATSSSNHR